MGSEKVKAKLSVALGKAVAAGIDILGDTVTEIINDNREDVKNIAKKKIDEAFDTNTKRPGEPIKFEHKR